MAGLWFVLDDKIGKNYVEQHPAIEEVGDEFAHLELPDVHI